MKKMFKVMGVTAIAVFSFIGCQKSQMLPNSACANQAKAQVHNNTQAVKGSGIAGANARGGSVKPSKEFFEQQAKEFGFTFSEAPAGYQPINDQIKGYSTIYLFDQGNFKTIEVFGFTDPAAQLIAEGGNTKDFWEDVSDGKLKCSGKGSLCGGGSTPCVMIAE